MIEKLLSLIFGKKETPATKPVVDDYKESVAEVEVEDEPEDEPETMSDYKRYQAKAEEIADKDDGSFDEKTLHGDHYTVEEYQQWVDIIFDYMKDDQRKESGGELTDEHIARLLDNAEVETFKKWNPSAFSDINRMAQFAQRTSIKMLTGSAAPMDEYDANDPLFAPINGITIEDYGALNARMASISMDDLASSLGVEVPALSEAIGAWTTRMQGDTTFRLSVVMSKAFSNVDNHPKLGAIKREVSAAGAATMAKMEAEPQFITELRAYQIAASEAGLDANQYLVDNYGITTAELMGAYAKTRDMSGMNTDFEAAAKEQEYFDIKKAEADKMFAAQVGGGVADDVNF